MTTLATIKQVGVARVAGLVAACLAIAFAAVLCAGAPTAAWAKTTVEAPVKVSDDITRLHVDKLDADTHEYVQGAKMAIIDEETGEVVDEWTTGEDTHENEKNLVVDRVYILREIEAPEGFEKAADTEFKVNATEGEGITILSGDDAELTQSYSLNLYDKAKDTEKEITVTGERNKEKTITTTKKVAPKTGDETPMSTVGILVGVGVALIVVLQLVKRRLRTRA